jgi:hypothetical protein
MKCHKREQSLCDPWPNMQIENTRLAQKGFKRTNALTCFSSVSDKRNNVARQVIIRANVGAPLK